MRRLYGLLGNLALITVISCSGLSNGSPVSTSGINSYGPPPRIEFPDRSATRKDQDFSSTANPTTGSEEEFTEEWDIGNLQGTYYRRPQTLKLSSPRERRTVVVTLEDRSTDPTCYAHVDRIREPNDRYVNNSRSYTDQWEISSAQKSVITYPCENHPDPSFIRDLLLLGARTF